MRLSHEGPRRNRFVIDERRKSRRKIVRRKNVYSNDFVVKDFTGIYFVSIS